MDSLVQDTNGDLYGTTYGGGSSGNGTVFSLSVGLGPFVKTQPISGQIGATVKILGTDLTGATSVTFNGVAARFTVSSSGTVLSTTVTDGSTAGTVQVVTPGGTLSSNCPSRLGRDHGGCCYPRYRPVFEHDGLGPVRQGFILFSSEVV
jgi:uncharacterized repeat protein (TIGR03803 family)